MSSNARTSTIVAPRILVQSEGSNDGVECSVHTLPKPLLREFRHVFQDTYLRRPEVTEMDTSTAEEEGNNNLNPQLVLIAIPTNQKAREDLVAVGDHIEKEKDRLLNVVSRLIN